MPFDNQKKKEFTDALRRTYKKLYEALCPIPYMRDKMFSVDSVFIDSGIEKRSKERLSSYTHMFKGCQTKGAKYVIQGKPGYGKSTLCLQMAYDWCNSVEGSPFRNVDILIILRLRQFGKTTSLWKAIKLFLVPLSALSVNDIKSIIQGSSSVKIILDGYDEYLENDGEGPIDKFIREQQGPNIDVIVTSRYLPKDLPSESEVLKLTGFDAYAREAYIRKAIVDDDDEINAIKDQFKGHNKLWALCIVPLLFVMFAHVVYEKKYYFRNFTRVTGIFHFIISCFHDHLRNKFSDDNVKKFYRFENDHKKLSQSAFEGLTQSGCSIVWTKRKLTDELTNDFYNRYVTLGILVPEETAYGSEHTTTNVRFYHDIFSEWYAAHYLAFMASKPEITLSSETSKKCVDDNTLFLGGIDPSNYEYIYCFACGIRPESEDKITKYLTNIGYNDLARLCSLENTRKRRHDDTHEKRSSNRQSEEDAVCSIF